MNKNGGAKYATKVSKEIKMSSFNGLKVVNELVDLNLIEKYKKKGVKRELVLTKKGKEVAIKLQELKEVLEKE